MSEKHLEMLSSHQQKENSVFPERHHLTNFVVHISIFCYLLTLETMKQTIVFHYLKWQI